MTEESTKKVNIEVSLTGRRLVLEGDFKEVTLNGVVISAPANDTGFVAKGGLVLGQQTPDGVYAGLTPNGYWQVFAMPKDLDVTMTFNDATKAVKKLNAENAFGHNDWQKGSLDAICVLRKNQNEGALKGTFNTTHKGGDSSDCYWTSQSPFYPPNNAHCVSFSDGWSSEVSYRLKNNGRLSCRPVRMVAAPAHLRSLGH